MSRRFRVILGAVLFVILALIAIVTATNRRRSH